MGRRTPEQMADAAEQQVRLERARLELSRMKLARRAVRAQEKALATYSAAKKDRTTRDWQARSTSADGAILPDLMLMDARSRQLIRDDSYAKGISRAYRRNVVGTGITPRSAAVDSQRQPLTAFNEQADILFHDWSNNPRRVDMERRRTFGDVQAHVIREFVAVGEAFVILTVRMDPMTGRGDLVLQLVESEQLDRYKISGCDPVTGEEHEVRGGVEVDRFGAAVAYWIYERHPNDIIGLTRPTPMTLESIRIPADRVCHIFDPERVRQTRGVTPLHASMRKLRDLSEFDYANLQAARAEACIGVLITTATGDGQIGLNQSTDDGAAQRQDADGNDELSFQPIMSARLAEGEDVKPFTPSRPGGSYEPFMQANVKAISAGAGVSYEQTTRDFTRGTYSSQRQGMLEDQREFEPLQQILINHLCIPVRELFIELQVLNGHLSAPGYHRLRDNYNYAEWQPPAWPWVDPEKEANADEKNLALGVETRQAICHRRGTDWREVARQRAVESAYERELATQYGNPATAAVVIEEETPATNQVDPTREQATGRDAESEVPFTLNGAQITAAVEILEKLGAGTVTADAAKILLESVGIPPDQVATMVASIQRDAASIRERLAPPEQPAEEVAHAVQ